MLVLPTNTQNELAAIISQPGVVGSHIVVTKFADQAQVAGHVPGCYQAAKHALERFAPGGRFVKGECVGVIVHTVDGERLEIEALPGAPAQVDTVIVFQVIVVARMAVLSVGTNVQII